jgi:hypothetical protein
MQLLISGPAGVGSGIRFGSAQGKLYGMTFPIDMKTRG